MKARSSFIIWLLLLSTIVCLAPNVLSNGTSYQVGVNVGDEFEYKITLVNVTEWNSTFEEYSTYHPDFIYNTTIWGELGDEWPVEILDINESGTTANITYNQTWAGMTYSDTQILYYNASEFVSTITRPTDLMFYFFIPLPAADYLEDLASAINASMPPGWTTDNQTNIVNGTELSVTKFNNSIINYTLVQTYSEVNGAMTGLSFLNSDGDTFYKMELIEEDETTTTNGNGSTDTTDTIPTIIAPPIGIGAHWIMIATAAGLVVVLKHQKHT